MRVGARRSFAATLLLSTLGACNPAAPVLRDAVVTGTWAGEHATLELTPTGGTIEYDCAHGRIVGALRTDGGGRFTAAGVHVREHGGPIRDGEPVDSAAALYAGSVEGDRLTLRVFVGPDSLGPFLLRRDGVPRLYKCL